MKSQDLTSELSDSEACLLNTMQSRWQVPWHPANISLGNWPQSALTAWLNTAFTCLDWEARSRSSPGRSLCFFCTLLCESGGGAETVENWVKNGKSMYLKSWHYHICSSEYTSQKPKAKLLNLWNKSNKAAGINSIFTSLFKDLIHLYHHTPSLKNPSQKKRESL
jgi:hypothetical protein